MSTTIAALGGDEREHYLAEALAGSGHDVRTFGGAVASPAAPYGRSPSASAAVADVAWILCPYPGLGIHDDVFAPASDVAIRLDRELLGASQAQQGGLILGRASPTVRALCDDLGIAVHETKADSGLAIKTATAVSEALAAVLIESTSRVLREHLFVVLGFGSTGFAITQLLLGLRCEVVVAARSRQDRERARHLGASAIAYADRVSVIETADIVINTVPHPDAVSLEVAASRTTARIFDIASPPGGMDHQALMGSGLDVQWVRGLGGLRAPVSMAEAQLDFVQELIETRRADDARPHGSTTRAQR